MSAGTFLDIVTILSGVFMLIVAFIILWNKLPEILLEWRILTGRQPPPTSSDEQQRQAVIAKAMQDVEACQDSSNKKEEHSTPQKMAIAQRASTGAATPDSQQSSLLQFALKDIDIDEEAEDYGDDYVAKFMKEDPRLAAAAMASPSSTNRSDSMADSCSVYLEGSVSVQSSNHNDTSTILGPMSYTNMFSPCSKIAHMSTADDEDVGEDLDDSSMSYSLDTIENHNNKECFSSFARPTSYSHIASRLEQEDDTHTMTDRDLVAASRMDPQVLSFLSSRNSHNHDDPNNFTFTTNILVSQQEQEEQYDAHSIQSTNTDNDNKSPPPKATEQRATTITKVVGTHKTPSPTTTTTTISRKKKDSTKSKKQHKPTAEKEAPWRRDSKRSTGSSSKRSAAEGSTKSKRSVASSKLSLPSSQRTPVLDDSSLKVDSNDSFSPLAQRNVTFSSTLMDSESSTSETSSQGSGNDNSSPDTTTSTTTTVNNNNMVLKKKQKPQITIITTNNKSLQSLHNHEGVVGGDDQSNGTPEIEKGITPNTVSTAGLWSPSGSMSPQTSQEDEDDDNVMVVERSFSTFADSLPSDERNDDSMMRRDDESPLHNVHVCRSASCTACRHPGNTPTFIATSKDSTGEYCKLTRQLPSRWWDSQQAQANYGQLKQYVSSMLLSSSSSNRNHHGGGSVLNRSLEDHPFDEA